MTQIISAIGSVLRDVLFYLSFHIPGIVVPRPGFHSVSLLSSSGHYFMVSTSRSKKISSIKEHIARE